MIGAIISVLSRGRGNKYFIDIILTNQTYFNNLILLKYISKALYYIIIFHRYYLYLTYFMCTMVHLAVLCAASVSKTLTFY